MSTHAALAAPPVLLVEDDPALRTELRELLEADGLPVVEVGDGWHAMNRLRSGEFSLVLLDIGLPIMDGWQVLAHMRADHVLRDIPVIILSAKPVAHAVGMPPVFKKPLGDPLPLLSAVHRHRGAVTAR